MRIAFVNMSRGMLLGNRRTRFADPVHLLDMGERCIKAGHESVIFQFAYPSAADSIEDIKSFAPQVLGLSFIGHEEENIEAAKQLLSAFPDKARPTLIIGGPDVDYYYEDYIEEFSVFFPHEEGLRRFVVVVGPGERYIEALAPYDFDILNDLAFQRLNSDFLVSDGVPIIGNLSPIPLDEQSFSRRYDMSPYFSAWVKWSTNCWGRCRYCSNVPRAIDNKSPSRAEQEAMHLISLGVTRISAADPNFVARPTRASKIIDRLPDKIESFHFAARVDSLYTAVKRHPEIWRKFAKKHHEIDLGVESFIPKRLLRLGKYPSLRQALKQKEKLDFLLDFFAKTHVSICFF